MDLGHYTERKNKNVNKPSLKMFLSTWTSEKAKRESKGGSFGCEYDTSF